MYQLLVVLPQTEIGGLHTFWTARAVYLESEGCSLTFVVPSDDVKAKFAPSEAAKVIVLHLPKLSKSQNVLENLLFPLVGIRSAFKLARYALRSKASYIVGHGAQSVLAALAARISKLPLILLLHGNVAHPKVALAHRAIVKSAFVGYELEGSSARYPSLFHSTPSFVIPPCISVSEQSLLEQRTLARELLNVPASKRVVAYAGTFTPAKRPDAFLRAVRATSSAHVCYRLVGKVPAGSEKWAAANVAQAAQRLANEGFDVELVDGRFGLRQYFPGIDMLVLTSVSEGVPNVALESLVAGTPILSVELPGVRSLAGSLAENGFGDAIVFCDYTDLEAGVSSPGFLSGDDRLALASRARELWNPMRAVAPIVHAIRSGEKGRNSV